MRLQGENMKLGMYLGFIILVTGCSMSKDQQIAATASGASSKLVVATDLDQRLAKWRRVEMTFDSARLSPRERQLVSKLVEASQYLDEIYWRQSDPEALDLYKSLAGKADARDQKLRRLLMINGSRFDLLDANKPFVGTEPLPPGGGLYPQGLTRPEIEAYVKAHPDEKTAIYSPTSVIRREGDRLLTVPYHQEYRQFLEPAAQALREAAALSDEDQFAKFLRRRADALLDDDYYPSDLAWLDLKNPKFERHHGAV